MATRREREVQARAVIIWKRRAVTVVLLVVTVFLVRAAWDVYGKEREAAENRAHAERDLADVENRKAQLEKNIDNLSSAEGVEAALRDQFKVGKPGEGMVVLVDAPKPTTTEEKKEKKSFWQWITGR